MGRMLSLSNLLFCSLLYLPVALPDLEISIAVLHTLLSLNWNFTLAFFFKVGSFGTRNVLDVKHLEALSGLIQFLATESPLKIMKNAFYFFTKALFVLKVFKFLS